MAWDSGKYILIQNNGISENFTHLAAVKKLYTLLLMQTLCRKICDDSSSGM